MSLLPASLSVGAVLLAGGCAFAFRRRQLLRANWGGDIHHVRLARRCRRLFQSYDIAVTDLNGFESDGAFNLRIPRDQFRDKIGTVKLVFRSPAFMQGRSFFNDLANQVTLGSDKTVIPVVVVNCPITPEQAHHAGEHGIAIIDTAQLRGLAESLQQLKLGNQPGYEGGSDFLRKVFTSAGQQRTDQDALEAAARNAEHRGAWEEAEENWLALIANNKNNWQAFLKLAECFRKQEKFDAAEHARMEACSLAPHRPEVLAERAKLAEALRDWPDALRVWSEIIKAHPTSLIGYRGRAYALAASGQVEEAGKFVNSYAPSFRWNSEAQLDVARMAEARGDWVAAEAAWRAYLEFDSKSIWVYTRLCLSIHKQGKTEELALTAAQSLAKFTEEECNNPNVLAGVRELRTYIPEGAEPVKNLPVH